MTPADIFQARVPRYTSYPTAPHFHDGVTEGTYRSWLAELAPGTPLSLYMHVPFCDTLCWFCACHTTVVNNNRPVRAYCDALIGEIALTAKALGHRHPVSHIHWGGGSPTLLCGDDMLRLDAAVRSHFDVSANAEFAVEIDPRGFTETMARDLAACGVTRASVGIQDMDPKVQQAINRVQSAAEVEDCVHRLRAHGINDINLDLVYGLPYQTLRGIDDNLQLAVCLAPQRIAVFGYAHVPYFKKHQALIPEEALPPVAQRLAMATHIEEALQQVGYMAVGIDHFALAPDSMAMALRRHTLRRNFQGYTVDAAPALLGLGASSIGALPQGYVQNATTVAQWRAMLAQGELPVVKGIALTAEDRLRRDAINELMCYLAVDLDEVCARHGQPADALDWALEPMRPLRQAGALSVSGRIIRIDPRMRAAARLASAVFDTYLPRGTARHSLSA